MRSRQLLISSHNFITNGKRVFSRSVFSLFQVILKVDTFPIVALVFSILALPSRIMISRIRDSEASTKLTLLTHYPDVHYESNSRGNFTENSLQSPLGKNCILALNEIDRDVNRAQIREMISQRISVGVLHLQATAGMTGGRERQLEEEDLLPVGQAKSLNGFQESTRFATQSDSIEGKFWNQTAICRKKTHDLFYLDEMERQTKPRKNKLNAAMDLFKSDPRRLPMIPWRVIGRM